MHKKCLILIFFILAPFAVKANALDLFKKAQKTGVYVFDDYENKPSEKPKDKEPAKAPEQKKAGEDSAQPPEPSAAEQKSPEKK